MSTQYNFRDLYHNQIEPVLKKQENFRNTVIFFLAMGPIILIVLFANTSSFNFLTSMIIVILGVLMSLHGLYRYKDYKRDYKKRVNARIINLINSDHKYFYENHFDLETVLNSGIYNHKPDSVSGDDHVTGKTGTISFEFCELHTHNALIKERMFSGLFFKIGLDRNLPANVYLFSDHNRQLLRNRHRSFEKDLGPKIKLHGEFARKFLGFSFNDHTALQLLGPNMQKALLSLREELDRDVHIAFHKNQIYCAVVLNEKLFEPKLLQKGPQPGEVMRSFELFTMVDKIVAHLNLSEEQIIQDTDSVTIEAEEKVPEIAKLAKQTQEPVINEIIDHEEPPQPKTDQSLNWQVLENYIIGLTEKEQARDLQTYLLALYKQIADSEEQSPTQALIEQFIANAFDTEPYVLDSSWLEISVSPDIEKLYLKAKTPEEMGFFNKQEHYGWDEKSFTLEVLKFQIAELEKMKGNQLDNAMRQYGVASQTGTPWYNFEPVANLNSGIRQLRTKSNAPTQVDWSLIGVILQLGRVNG